MPRHGNKLTESILILSNLLAEVNSANIEGERAKVIPFSEFDIIELAEVRVKFPVKFEVFGIDSTICLLNLEFIRSGLVLDQIGRALQHFDYDPKVTLALLFDFCLQAKETEVVEILCFVFK